MVSSWRSRTNTDKGWATRRRPILLHELALHIRLLPSLWQEPDLGFSTMVSRTADSRRISERIILSNSTLISRLVMTTRQSPSLVVQLRVQAALLFSRPASPAHRLVHSQ